MNPVNQRGTLAGPIRPDLHREAVNLLVHGTDLSGNHSHANPHQHGSPQEHDQQMLPLGAHDVDSDLERGV
jgi:hypothetical protein